MFKLSNRERETAVVNNKTQKCQQTGTVLIVHLPNTSLQVSASSEHLTAICDGYVIQITTLSFTITSSFF